ncbi:hypothetical protein CV102_10365 [Natronococcus pandeyae]|uniref:Uncharacterized protein n=1 Tax=Natronococcus pandeyae TaxID=2055836 RepID=A0A8J8TST0_9EURY|nr:hypothetical protein [Natronococcus pandeyae]TYL38902.1 hypothetical protein CV102_10365 [Natronococcus pandeyae]
MALLRRRGVRRFLSIGQTYVRHKLFRYLALMIASLPGSTTGIRWWFRLWLRLVPNTTDADPLKPIYVSPERIEYYHHGEPRGIGRVRGGNWDRDRKRFTDDIVYRSLERRYRDGVPWEETELYRAELDDVRRRTGRSPEELREYFETIDDLYRRIEREGYKSQRELLAENPRTTAVANNDAIHPVLNEVAVNIYSDGSLAKKSSGRHRLAIARLLEIDRIPVVVRTRHAEWQAIRDEIRSTDSDAALSEEARRHLDHPDLRDITPLSGERKSARTGSRCG